MSDLRFSSSAGLRERDARPAKVSLLSIRAGGQLGVFSGATGSPKVRHLNIPPDKLAACL